MNKERLEEIKDSIELQMQVQQSLGYRSSYDDLLTEEIDLYNEVIELQERIVYLERSNERKEETIIDYQINEYSILEKLKKWLEEQKQFIDDIPTFSKDIKNNHLGMIGAYQNTFDKIKELEEGVR